MGQIDYEVLLLILVAFLAILFFKRWMLEALIEAIGCDRDDLCTGCLTGCYPLAIQGEVAKPRQVNFVDETIQSKLEAFEA